MLAEVSSVIIFSFEAAGISIQELTGKMCLAHEVNFISKNPDCDYFCDPPPLTMDLRSNTPHQT